MRRRLVLFPVLVLLLVAGVAIPATAQTWAPWWATRDEGTMIDWLNGQRTWYGPSALAVDSDLTIAARQHAQRLAACNCLYHQDLTPLLRRGWRIAGENVAYGGDLWQNHVALSYSQPHLTNMLRPDFKGFGVGVAVANGRVYVAQVFGGW